MPVWIAIIILLTLSSLLFSLLTLPAWLVGFLGAQIWGEKWLTTIPAFLTVIPLFLLGSYAWLVVVAFTCFDKSMNINSIMVFTDGIAGICLVGMVSLVPIVIGDELLSRIAKGKTPEERIAQIPFLLIAINMLLFFALALLWVSPPNTSLIDALQNPRLIPEFPDTQLRLTRLWSLAVADLSSVLVNLTLSQIVAGIMFIGTLGEGLKLLRSGYEKLLRFISLVLSKGKPAGGATP